MSEESLSNEEIFAACDYVYRGKQYYDFLHELLTRIPFLSLWDLCNVYARDMIDEGSVPDCIKGIDLKLLGEAIESNPDELPAFLILIQKWLSEQLAISIDKKEINPKILGRFADGKIDPKRTYIDNNELNDWLVCRDIYVSDLNDNFFPDYYRLLEYMYDDILRISRLLQVKTYNPDFKISDIDSIEPGYLIVEKNAQLRAQSHIKSHGNAEHNAKKREKVLGAALSVIIQWPNQCQNSSGKFEATKIAKLIDEKSILYWHETGEPPLSRDTIEREISKWINKAV